MASDGTWACCAWGDDLFGDLVALGKIGMGTLQDLLSHYFTADVAMMMATGLLGAIKVCACAVRAPALLLLLLLCSSESLSSICARCAAVRCVAPHRHMF